MDNEYLIQKAAHIRRIILETVVTSGKGHIGGALSCADLLVALYHGKIIRVDPSRPTWKERDRFILSKGHASIALFAVLADMDFIGLDELQTYCQDGTRLGGHPDRCVPGIEVDTGSLGHGLGLGAGIALAAKLDGHDHRTVVLIGDGESHEGSIWEAAMFGGQHRLANLTVIVDRNGQCATDFTEACNGLHPIADKWNAFGWETREIDGHDFDQIHSALKGRRHCENQKPLAVIARTIKGKGVSYMEKCVEWHHGVPSGETLITARRELNGNEQDCK